MTLLYPAAVGATYFVQAGMGRDAKNAPPLILLLRGLLTFTLTRTLGLALLLGWPPSSRRPSFPGGFLLNLALPRGSVL